jgi:hypothetical protein
VGLCIYFVSIDHLHDIGQVSCHTYKSKVTIFTIFLLQNIIKCLWRIQWNEDCMMTCLISLLTHFLLMVAWRSQRISQLYSELIMSEFLNEALQIQGRWRCQDCASPVASELLEILYWKDPSVRVFTDMPASVPLRLCPPKNSKSVSFEQPSYLNSPLRHLLSFVLCANSNATQMQKTRNVYKIWARTLLMMTSAT